uniref:Uncharacterized protein n=1 Tax=viral metagenome TaxID=1070528 RepID=A0A6H1ZT48_9ZZZZ
MFSLGKTLGLTANRQAPYSTFSFTGWPLGLNTAIQSFEIAKKELAEAINIKINSGGQLETRPAINKHTSTAITGKAIKFIARCPIGATNYELLVDEDDKLYYINSGTPTQIGSALEDEAYIFPYKGAAVICDGSYLKYIDGVSSIKMAYDDGTGTNGYQFNNSDGADSGSTALGNGTNTRLAYKFTSQAWDAGYTIPPTTATFKLSKTGSPTGNATLYIRKTADGSSIASKTFIDVSTLTTTATEYSISFVAADISSQMSPSIGYYCSLEYSGGDGSNYVKVHYTTVSTSGHSSVYAGSWTDSSVQDPIASLRPGRPPKAKFGVVWKNRPILGGDPDNPGYIWYGNLTYLDWSTANGGGNVGLVDSDSNNFPVGGIEAVFGDLFVFGKQSQPCIAKLTGSSPSDYSLPLLLQQVWSTHKTLKGVVNDLWYTSEDGVGALTGVEIYGDLRTTLISDPVDDRIKDYWNTSNTIAAYYPRDGQYWVVFPSYHRVLVVNSKIAVSYLGAIRYPSTEYELYRADYTTDDYKWTIGSAGTNEYYLQTAAGGDPSISVAPDALTIDNELMTEGTIGSLEDHQWAFGDNNGLGYNSVYIKDDSGDPDTTGVTVRSLIIPTSLASYDGNIYIGASDGFVYKVDTSVYKDIDVLQINPRFKTAYIEMPFVHANIAQVQLFAHSLNGASVDLNIYRDGFSLTPAKTIAFNLPISDSAVLGDMDMDLGDADFSISGSQNPIWERTNLNARTFQIGMDDVIITDKALFVSGVLLKYRKLEF